MVFIKRNVRQSIKTLMQMTVIGFALVTFLPNQTFAEEAKPAQMLENFEGKLSWKKGFITKGSKGNISISNDKIFEKGYVGKIDYDFETPKGQISFWRNIDLKTVPEHIGVWVNSNKPLGIFLRLRDANGETFQWTASFKPDPNGKYNYLEYFIFGEKSQWGGDKNAKIDLPIKAMGILIFSPNAGSGTVYLDVISVPKKQKKALPNQKKRLTVKDSLQSWNYRNY